MAVETTIQGKNVLVYQSGDTLNFEFTDGHSAPESSPALIETGPSVWDSVAINGSGFEVIWDSAVGAAPPRSCTTIMAIQWAAPSRCPERPPRRSMRAPRLNWRR